jgi:hypothetical protein
MKRTDAPRFTVGETVKIHSFRRPRLDWVRGTIEQVKQHGGRSALDEFIVRVKGEPEPIAFWEVELRKSDETTRS